MLPHNSHLSTPIFTRLATLVTDSAICYELMVWRRSALWTLILFGSLATFFAITAINTDALNTEAYYDLAKNGVLHRFPMPGYLQPYTREVRNCEDEAQRGAK